MQKKLKMKKFRSRWFNNNNDDVDADKKYVFFQDADSVFVVDGTKQKIFCIRKFKCCCCLVNVVIHVEEWKE